MARLIYVLILIGPIYISFQAGLNQKTLALPEGRLHFAGEHTETPHGWIDTAIHTGVRWVDYF